jgi:hypothetical protein
MFVRLLFSGSARNVPSMLRAHGVEPLCRLNLLLFFVGLLRVVLPSAGNSGNGIQCEIPSCSKGGSGSQK